MNIGEINKLKVVRKSDLGFMLTDGKDDVLMHFRESIKEYNDNDEVEAFIFYDKAGRTCATTKTPVMTLSKPGFARVVNIINTMGIFLENNCSKDVLISKDYLPYELDKWPKINDIILAKLKLKGESLVAKPMNRDELKEMKNTIEYAEGELVNGFVSKISESGVGIISKDMTYIFVPKIMLRNDYHIGEEVSVKITKKNGNFEYYGSLNENKEVLVDKDKETIINYLKNHNGKMSITAKSSSEEIEARFKMSRKAFKRALGALYKEKVVSIDEDITTLN